MKRQVTYNQDAVLCPCCTKRIRLNNDGYVRVHVSGKAGSARCPGSGAYSEVASQTDLSAVDNSPSQAKTVPVDFLLKDSPQDLYRDLFSDLRS